MTSSEVIRSRTNYRNENLPNQAKKTSSTPQIINVLYS